MKPNHPNPYDFNTSFKSIGEKYFSWTLIQHIFRNTYDSLSDLSCSDLVVDKILSLKVKPILDVSARIETMASVRCQCAGALHAIYISQDFKSATLATRAGIFYAKEIQVLKTKANSWWQRLLLLLKTPHKSLKLCNWNLSKKDTSFLIFLT